jgi:hypothetical protein
MSHARLANGVGCRDVFPVGVNIPGCKRRVAISSGTADGIPCDVFRKYRREDGQQGSEDGCVDHDDIREEAFGGRKSECSCSTKREDDHIALLYFYLQ